MHPKYLWLSPALLRFCFRYLVPMSSPNVFNYVDLSPCKTQRPYPCIVFHVHIPCTCTHYLTFPVCFCLVLTHSYVLRASTMLLPICLCTRGFVHGYLNPQSTSTYCKTCPTMSSFGLLSSLVCNPTNPLIFDYRRCDKPLQLKGLNVLIKSSSIFSLLS